MKRMMVGAGLVLVLVAAGGRAVCAQSDVSGDYNFSGSTTGKRGLQADQVPATWDGTERLDQPAGSTQFSGSGKLNRQDVVETGFVSGTVIRVFIGGLSIGTTPATIELTGTQTASGAIEGTMKGETFDRQTTWTGTFSKQPAAPSCVHHFVFEDTCLCRVKNMLDNRVEERSQVGKAGVRFHSVQGSTSPHTVRVEINNTKVLQFKDLPEIQNLRQDDLTCDREEHEVTFPLVDVKPGVSKVTIFFDNDSITVDYHVIGYRPVVAWRVIPSEVKMFRGIQTEALAVGQSDVKGDTAISQGGIARVKVAGYRLDGASHLTVGADIHVEVEPSDPTEPGRCVEGIVPARIDARQVAVVAAETHGRLERGTQVSANGFAKSNLPFSNLVFTPPSPTVLRIPRPEEPSFVRGSFFLETLIFGPFTTFSLAPNRPAGPPHSKADGWNSSMEPGAGYNFETSFELAVRLRGSGVMLIDLAVSPLDLEIKLSCLH